MIYLAFIAVDSFCFGLFSVSVVKLQRKIYAANLALRYFIRTHWVFKNANFLELNSCIWTEDDEAFRFDKFITGDVRKYFISCMYGEYQYTFICTNFNDNKFFLRYQVLVDICCMKKMKICHEHDEPIKGDDFLWRFPFLSNLNSE